MRDPLDSSVPKSALGFKGLTGLAVVFPMLRRETEVANWMNVRPGVFVPALWTESKWSRFHKSSVFRSLASKL